MTNFGAMFCRMLGHRWTKHKIKKFKTVEEGTEWIKGFLKDHSMAACSVDTVDSVDAINSDKKTHLFLYCERCRCFKITEIK